MKGYLDKITVVAYVLIEGEIILSTPVTRSVAEVRLWRMIMVNQ